MDKVIYKTTPDGEPIAFILDCPCLGANIMSYMHVGQHGEASYAFYKECRNATIEDYQELHDELKSIGYKPVALQKLPPNYMFIKTLDN